MHMEIEMSRYVRRMVELEASGHMPAVKDNGTCKG
jgi:hypothetical protein